MNYGGWPKKVERVVLEKRSCVNEKSNFLGFHWLPGSLDGGEMYLLKSYSCKSNGVHGYSS